MKTFLKIIATIIKWYFILDVVCWSFLGILDLAELFIKTGKISSLGEYSDVVGGYYEERFQKFQNLIEG